MTATAVSKFSFHVLTSSRMNPQCVVTLCNGGDLGVVETRSERSAEDDEIEDTARLRGELRWTVTKTSLQFGDKGEDKRLDGVEKSLCPVVFWMDGRRAEEHICLPVSLA